MSILLSPTCHSRASHLPKSRVHRMQRASASAYRSTFRLPLPHHLEATSPKPPSHHLQAASPTPPSNYLSALSTTPPTKPCFQVADTLIQPLRYRLSTTALPLPLVNRDTSSSVTALSSGLGKKEIGAGVGMRVLPWRGSVLDGAGLKVECTGARPRL